MNTDRLEALLWKRIDGVLDEAEASELDAHLRSHPESAGLELEIAELSLRLSQVEEAQPPAALRQRIDDALLEVAPRREVTPPTVAPIHRLRQSVWHRQLLPLAAGLVLGAAVATLLIPGDGGSVDRSQASGAMVGSPAAGAPQSIEVDLGPTFGRLTATRSETGLVLDLEVTGQVTVELSLETSPEPLQLAGADRFGSSASALTVLDTSLVLDAVGPSRHRLTVTEPGPGHSIQVVVTADGTVLAERSILLETGGDER